MKNAAYECGSVLSVKDVMRGYARFAKTIQLQHRERQRPGHACNSQMLVKPNEPGSLCPSVASCKVLSLTRSLPLPVL
jgi:hypothetical protein